MNNMNVILPFSAVDNALCICTLALDFRALNGSATDAHWMMGNSLNPNSNMVKEMAVALEAESKMHGAAVDTKNYRETTGVPFPKRRRVRSNIYREERIAPYFLAFSALIHSGRFRRRSPVCGVGIGRKESAADVGRVAREAMGAGQPVPHGASQPF